MAQRVTHNWAPSFAVIIGFLPVVMGLGAWVLTNSNRQAVTESTVSVHTDQLKDDEDRIEQLEIQVASQRCK
jgi:hypothetical protein